MRLPDGVTDAVAEEVDGWAGSVRAVDGDTIVSFEGGPLADDVEGTFGVTMTLPSTPDTTIYFPFVQRCEVGEIRWIGIPAEPGDVLDEPAPAMRLTGPVATTVPNSPAPTTAPAAPTTTDAAAPTTVAPTTAPATTSPSTTEATPSTSEPVVVAAAGGQGGNSTTGTIAFILSVTAVLALFGFVAWRARASKAAAAATATGAAGESG